MSNPQIKQRKEANASRHSKMLKPWEPRKGQIKLGKSYHKCSNCGSRHLAAVEVCPDCGKNKWGWSVPEKTSYFVFYGDANAKGVSQGHAEFGNDIIEIPITLKDIPSKCAVIQYECWRGGKMYCSSRWVPDEVGKYHFTAKAYRQDFGEVKCDPKTCPLHNGGTIQDANGDTLTIKPGSPWCKQKVTVSVWVPALPGLDSYTIKSGSIESIMNVMWAVRNLTSLMRITGTSSLRYMLKMQNGQSKYKNEGGEWKIAKYKTFKIEFPFSIEKLIKQAERGDLKLSDISYALPGTLQPVSKSLPAPKDGLYDPLVDPAIEPDIDVAHKTKSPAADKSTRIDDLKTIKEPVRNLDVKPTPDQMKKIVGPFRAMRAYLKPDEYERVKKNLCETFGITRTASGAMEFSKCLDTSSAVKVMEWLKNKIESDMTREDKY